AQLGYCVIAIRPGTKLPATQHGVKDGTADPAVLTSWLTTLPNANIAVCCDGLLVIDVDPNGQHWARQEHIATALSQAGAICKTPKGTHYYFRKPVGCRIGNSTGLIAVGVDTKSDNGYVLCAPSQTSDGMYTWQVPLESEPEHLPELPAVLQREIENATQRNGAADADKLIPATIPQGRRHDELLRLAGRLRAYGLDADEIYATLTAANRKRCSPPEDEHELRKLAASVCRYPPNEVLNEWLKYGEQPPPEEDDPGRLFRDAAAITPEPIRWLMPPFLAKGKLSLLSGRPKLGKSMIGLTIAARVSSGTPDKVFQPGDAADVGVISLEDDPSDTQVPRLIAAGADLKRISFLAEPATFCIDQVAVLDRWLEAKPQLRLIIIDPVGAFLPTGADTNKESDVRAALVPLQRWAQQNDVAVLLIGHHRKSGPMERVNDWDQESLGATGFVGVSRILMHVVRMRGNPKLRELKLTSSNVGTGMQNWLFDIEGVDGGGVATARIVWPELNLCQQILAETGLPGTDAVSIEEELTRLGGRARQGDLVIYFAQKYGLASSSSTARERVREAVRHLVEQKRAEVYRDGRQHRQRTVPVLGSRQCDLTCCIMNIL
ncbi:MAG: AAA family ATPase, partial [Gemmatales bacterium]|nr:AAA family ATPase [Gemmatales bacterium]MDW8386434.1 AAA family ATPase [Gemmatales bacterium]